MGVTVHVSNLVSAEWKNITLIKDAHGKLRYLDPIMYQNNQTLILPRNITHVYVLTRSANNDPAVDQSADDKTVVIIPVVVAFVILLLAVAAIIYHYTKDCRRNNEASYTPAEQKVSTQA